MRSSLNWARLLPVLVLLLVGAGIIAVGITAGLPSADNQSDLVTPIILITIGGTFLLSGVVLALSDQRLTDRRSVGRFLSVVVQLGLLVLVIRQYHLEDKAFYSNVLLLTFFGFLIHYALPFHYRLPFFLLLSLVSILAVSGFQNGAWLIGLGLCLIGICHLPVSFSARVAILLATGAFLAILRADWIHAPWPNIIWPILGSMFMFRLIVYLYDLKHHKEPVRVSHILSYFFLLPNVIFPLFPVVDYSTFRRTYYDSDPHQIYQTGVEWMFRGVTHLILYRFVNYYLVIAPEDIISTGDLVRYLIVNFLLYLRVSGQFHLIVGILHLFGFNLPETNHRYCLAHNFADFWRRINMYWRAFMLKVFYYPAYFRLRKWGVTTGIVLSTCFVFLATWFLHAYQWFWLRGSFLLSWPDVLFWAILALLVVPNSLYEAKHGRERTLGKRSWTWRDIIPRTLHIAGTFTVICILWSLWTSTSLSEWFSLWAVARWDVTAGLLPTFLVIGIVFNGTFRGEKGGKGAKGTSSKWTTLFRSPAVTGALIFLLYLIGNPVVYTQLGGKFQEVIRDLTVARLSDQDAALLERGYYENLQVNRFNTQLWEIYMRQPQDSTGIGHAEAELPEPPPTPMPTLEGGTSTELTKPPPTPVPRSEDQTNIEHTETTRLTGDFLEKELVPSAQILFKGQPFSTNRWGMRDQDYERDIPPNTYRIALVGPSSAMGWGVADNETFEWLLEERLNRENDGEAYARYEILNFGVRGYSPLQELLLLETKVLSFEPDAIFYTAHRRERENSILHLVKMTQQQIDVPYEYLREVVRKAGINEQTSETMAKRHLIPFGDEMLSWTYRRIVENCQQRGILPVWIYVPSIRDIDRSNPKEIADLIHLAEETGFVVLNVSDVYENQDAEAIRVSDLDWHPNAQGHQLISDQLYEALRDKDETIPLGLPIQTGEP